MWKMSFSSAMQAMMLVSAAFSTSSWGHQVFERDQDPIFPGGLQSIVSFAIGDWHTCMLSADTLACWGQNEYGQTPQLITGYKNAKHVGAGSVLTCVLDDESVYCYGRGAALIPYLHRPTQLAVGGNHACAIDQEGVKCWGENDSGQSNVPNDLKNPRVISAGPQISCAIDDNGVKCWGRDFSEFGEAGKIPQNLKNPRAISAGGHHNCVIDDEGVKCWGSNWWGEGIIPKDLKNPSKIESQGERNCVLDDEGVKCWGWNYSGASSPPLDLKGTWAINSSHYRSCAMDTSGLKCWGSASDYSGLKHTFGQEKFPRGVKNPTSIWMGQKAFEDSSCALVEVGLTCWGAGPDLMIHDSKLPDRKRNPRHLTFGGANQACVVDDVGLNCWGGTVWPQIKNVRALAASENHTCALGENGVQCWGDDRFGQSKVPTTLVNPRAISVAVGKSCALVCP